MTAYYNAVCHRLKDTFPTDSPEISHLRGFRHAGAIIIYRADKAIAKVFAPIPFTFVCWIWHSAWFVLPLHTNMKYCQYL